jgi:hypothetical protein
MNSLDKIEQLRREYTGPPPPDVEGTELALRSMIAMAGPLLPQFLPAIPAVLDEAIEEMAGKLLALRSDDARLLRVAPVPELQPDADA